MTELHPSAAVRYAAHDAPRKWHEATWEQAGYGRQPGGTARLAHYSHPMKNRAWYKRSGIVDGIHVEVRSNPDVNRGRPYVDGECSRPDRARAQFNAGRSFDTWEEAMVYAREYVRLAQAFARLDKNPVRDRFIEARRALNMAQAYRRNVKPAERTEAAARRAFERSVLGGSK